MVKKGSIFSRLAERWRTGAGVRIEATGERAGDDAPRAEAGSRIESARASVSRVEPRAARVEMPSTAFAGEARSTRKLSEREDAMVALGSHFQELASLLRGVHTRMDGQLGRLVETATSLQQLPALSNQQLDLLRGMSTQLEKQNVLGEQIARTLHGLPQLLTSVESALQRAAQNDERTSTTMREFQSTMDRIHQAMGRMVDNSDQQTKATQNLVAQREDSLKQIATGIEQAQRDAVKELRTAADESMQTLRRSHEDQSNRLQRAVQDHAGWNKAVLVLLGVVALGMLTTIVVLFLK